MNELEKPVEVPAIEGMESEDQDDIFIMWGSPEDRCKGVISKLSEGYRVDKIYLIRYQDHDNKKRDDNIIWMKKKLKNKGKIHEIVMDEANPFYMFYILLQNVQDVIKIKGKIKINIDISCPIKWHLLVLLKQFDLIGVLNKIRFFYTEPQDYLTNLFQPLSFGIKDIFPICHFHENYDFSKDTLLILMLGYEGNRAMALYECVNPDETLLLIANPAYHQEWEGRTELMNDEIINLIGDSKIRYIDARNPVKIANQMDELLKDDLYKRYNKVIVPLGTKPQILGLYLHMRTNPENTIILYGAPRRHNHLFYSKGIGKTWLLPFG